jgi:hypothetical protein
MIVAVDPLAALVSGPCTPDAGWPCKKGWFRPMIRFHCPSCKSLLEAKESVTKCDCPGCGQRVRVPVTSANDKTTLGPLPEAMLLPDASPRSVPRWAWAIIAGQTLAIAFLCGLLFAGRLGNPGSMAAGVALPGDTVALPPATYTITQAGATGGSHVSKPGSRPSISGGVIVFTDQVSGMTCAVSGSYSVTGFNLQPAINVQGK